MTREEIRAAVLRTLGEIAPEADPATLAPDVPFRDQLDLDSMDHLNFVIALHAALQVEIPEADYPQARHARRLRGLSRRGGRRPPLTWGDRSARARDYRAGSGGLGSSASTV